MKCILKYNLSHHTDVLMDFRLCYRYNNILSDYVPSVKHDKFKINLIHTYFNVSPPSPRLIVSKKIKHGNIAWHTNTNNHRSGRICVSNVTHAIRSTYLLNIPHDFLYNQNIFICIIFNIRMYFIIISLILTVTAHDLISNKNIETLDRPPKFACRGRYLRGPTICIYIVCSTQKRSG